MSSIVWEVPRCSTKRNQKRWKTHKHRWRRAVGAFSIQPSCHIGTLGSPFLSPSHKINTHPILKGMRYVLTKRTVPLLTTLSPFASLSHTCAFSTNLVRKSFASATTSSHSLPPLFRTYSSQSATLLSMSSNGKKPSFPDGYVVPDVWKYDQEKMKPIHKSNLPTSGAQTKKELPQGKHDIQLYGLGTLSK